MSKKKKSSELLALLRALQNLAVALYKTITFFKKFRGYFVAWLDTPKFKKE